MGGEAMTAILKFVALGLLGALVSCFVVLCWLGAVADVVLLMTEDTMGWRAVSHVMGALWNIVFGAALFLAIGHALVAAIAGEKPCPCGREGSLDHEDFCEEKP
jgi:hypothetical protein